MQRKNQLTRTRDNRPAAKALRTEITAAVATDPRKDYDKSVKIRKIANGYTVTNLANSEQKFAAKLYDDNGGDIVDILSEIFEEKL